MPTIMPEQRDQDSIGQPMRSPRPAIERQNLPSPGLVRFPKLWIRLLRIMQHRPKYLADVFLSSLDWSCLWMGRKPYLECGVQRHNTHFVGANNGLTHFLDRLVETQFGHPIDEQQKDKTPLQ